MVHDLQRFTHWPHGVCPAGLVLQRMLATYHDASFSFFTSLDILPATSTLFHAESGG